MLLGITNGAPQGKGPPPLPASAYSLREQKPPLRRKRKYVFVVLIAALTFAAFLWCGLPQRMGPKETTHSRMRLLWLRMNKYSEEHGHPPAALEALPPTAEKDNAIKDGWGRRFLYTQLANGMLVLRSLGADGRPGGQGHDEDLELKWRPGKFPGTIPSQGQ